MKNAKMIESVAKQLTLVCAQIIGLCESEETDLFNDMFWDELGHAQKLVLEFTEYAFDGDEPEETEEKKIEYNDENFDEAFFAGELNSVIGEKKNDDQVVIDLEEEEDEK